jgi:hypothetical protein
VNTTYYWEGKLGILTFPAFLILVIVFVGLFITLLRQLYFATKEKFKDKQRSYKIALLTVVLTLTIFKPFGLVDFDKLKGADILIATREGGGNCTTTLKLKENYEFRQRDVCFGVSEVKGTYRISNDTIYFETSDFNKGKNKYYDFAVIRPTKYGMEDNKFDLVLFNKNDTLGHKLYVIKNEISKRK